MLQPQLSNKALADLCHRLSVETDAGIDIRRTWQREAWPISFGGGTLMHCIVSSPQGESTGTVVR